MEIDYYNFMCKKKKKKRYSLISYSHSACTHKSNINFYFSLIFCFYHTHKKKMYNQKLNEE